MFALFQKFELRNAYDRETISRNGGPNMTAMKIVLGIHDGHGAGAALLVDGKIVAALSEERIRNVKNYSGAPLGAIEEVYRIAKINPKDTSLVAIVGLVRSTAPIVEEDSLKVKAFRKFSRLVHSRWFAKTYVWFLHKFRRMQDIERVLSKMGMAEVECAFIEHHLAHAAIAFYQRPWDDETLILTLDGAGDGVSSTVSLGNRNKISRIDWSTYYDSISNNMYSEITGLLGLKRWEHEYKVMGMAPYGRAQYSLSQMMKICQVDKKHPLRFKNTLGPYGKDVQHKLGKMFKGHRFDNISAACQSWFETLVVKWTKNAINETGINKIATAGGSFLNVKANSILRELPEVEDIFFHPACDDMGTPIGAAILGYNRLCERDGNQPKRYPLEDLYFGREYNNDDVTSTLGHFDTRVAYSQEDDIEEMIADAVSEGKIVARFNGREEFGPRALGNRSIIADPRDMKVIRKINFAIKYRDFWMPFAPSIEESQMRDFFDNPRPARYMIEAFPTTERGPEIVAALHPFDYTGRPQSVTLKHNEKWFKIIHTFGEKTGVPVVLNTSFNLHGFPIVGSPDVAIETFLHSGLDVLALGNFMISKKQ
jgi:carbamoyltransferase